MSHGTFSNDSTVVASSENLDRPKILLMGLRRGGKSSICNVVFHNMQPLDTVFLESTSRPTSELIRSLVDFTVSEMPGQINVLDDNYDKARLFENVGSLVYVVDSQDEYLYTLSNLVDIIEAVYPEYPSINFEILIHKVDGLSDDFKGDTARDIRQRVTDDLLDLGLDGVKSFFHLTSIFNHSIFDAFSLIIQKLIPEVPTLRNMLDILCEHTGLEQAYLFDINSKLFVASDNTSSSGVGGASMEHFADFIDISVDLDNLYFESSSTSVTSSSETNADQNNNNTLLNGNKAAGPSALTTQSNSTSKKGLSPSHPRPLKCVSKLANGTTLYLYQMIRGLAIVALTRKEGPHRMALVDYNLEKFRLGLERVWPVA
ncbi:hypothetical protein NADFUDRAFT_52011 [Nadsonia fulvescens var. elongata DSM 6958]|uniref:GTP-binding protein n=1 Tax=Nadsonia fulvescens var. elongata DSM 6958 TaxID=857566 RepID=A0A1E3PJ89_9ASCO|nr:hypothetical protein NADFUDRAFT_52011 [Nadsonia fulvescens var. elongata DSM 6958]